MWQKQLDEAQGSSAKTGQIIMNGAFHFWCKQCFLDTANQWLQIIRECGRESAAHLWLEHIWKRKMKRTDKNLFRNKSKQIAIRNGENNSKYKEKLAK